MKIYRISQDENDGYDTYDSAIVVANDAKEAATIHPCGMDRWPDDDEYHLLDEWCSSPDLVKVEEIGEAGPQFNKPGVILASYNAG